MSLPEIVLIAIGLSMDAFAVSISLGLSVKRLKPKNVLIPGLFIGFFQAFMPVVGYFTGSRFANKIQHLDHWIAFALLGFIGGKMIFESLSKKKAPEKSKGNAFQFTKLLVLAIATSIDALAIGITFAVLQVNVFNAAIIIGLITFLIAMAGVKIGNIFGVKYKSKAEFMGGAILIIMGIKIVIEHMFFSGSLP
jgi:putative Mn2+ efflux pump MntP